MKEHVISSYRDLVVWKKSIDLSIIVYEITEKFPTSERYGLVSQMRRSAVSIPSNIAEGRARGTRKDFRNFLRIAYASGAELETQIVIAKRLTKTRTLVYSEADVLLDEVMRMLNALIRKMDDNSENPSSTSSNS